MSVFIKLAVVCVFLATTINVQADEISIQKNEVQDGNNGIITHFVISSKPGGQTAKVQYQGVVDNIQYNKARTICAINLHPGTETNDVYLAVLMHSGAIKLIKDFNGQLGKDFKYGNEALTTDYVYINNIKDRTLSVSCGTKGEANYSLRVEINLRGEIRIVPGSISKE